MTPGVLSYPKHSIFHQPISGVRKHRQPRAIQRQIAGPVFWSTSRVEVLAGAVLEMFNLDKKRFIETRSGEMPKTDVVFH
jgi:hypothetical protein